MGKTHSRIIHAVAFSVEDAHATLLENLTVSGTPYDYDDDGLFVLCTHGHKKRPVFIHKYTDSRILVHIFIKFH